MDHRILAALLIGLSVGLSCGGTIGFRLGYLNGGLECLDQSVKHMTESLNGR